MSGEVRLKEGKKAVHLSSIRYTGELCTLPDVSQLFMDRPLAPYARPCFSTTATYSVGYTLDLRQRANRGAVLESATSWRSSN